MGRLKARDLRAVGAILIGLVAFGVCVGAGFALWKFTQLRRFTLDIATAADPPATRELYPVVSVADGDTITVAIDGINERVRLIGIDAPELHNPSECFARESADHARGVLTGTSVHLVADPSQDDRDRYGRLLRYVFLPDGANVNADLVASGYAYEYTFDDPYRYQDLFLADQRSAESGGVGVWAAGGCAGQRLPQGAPTGSGATSPAPSDGCLIKGNINVKGEKIYHLPGDDSYDDTVITAAKGERFFCSEADAMAAGWRAAKR
jgi:endonuclease YncB( thermonuclease family)